MNSLGFPFSCLKIDGFCVTFPRAAERFQRCVQIFDVDNSETITTEELLLVMKNLGMMATKEEVKEMLSEVDEDGSGEIDFEELQNLWSNR
ncbi:hypothetical protein OS493_005339 [Desmophyllum pertusum]|uniref:EF-hand domain-containing protein n=1 Tax=Desmophyllum pertusum TaxID=174260 RepID=A0A9W9YS06_9CNID|nr:hypothetical protein OS493_005339 [Desmophyllum pertusum]